MSKSLTNAEYRYNNIKREALGILNGLEKFHCYYFARDVSIRTDHKPLVSIFKKRHSNPVTVNPVHPPEKTSIQGQDNIKAIAGNLYHGLAIPT